MCRACGAERGAASVAVENIARRANRAASACDTSITAKALASLPITRNPRIGFVQKQSSRLAQKVFEFKAPIYGNRVTLEPENNPDCRAESGRNGAPITGVGCRRVL
jgi:hypothetical protein